MRRYHIYSKAAIARLEREDDDRTKAAWLNAYLQRVDGEKFPSLKKLLTGHSEDIIDIDPETNTQIAIELFKDLSASLPKVKPAGWIDPNER